MALKVFEKVSSFRVPGKSTEYGLESFGICFKRSLKVFDFQYFIIIITTMWAVSV